MKEEKDVRREGHRGNGRFTHNSLQKSMALTARAPSAGPTGGDGDALPAGTTIFFCQFLLAYVAGRGTHDYLLDGLGRHDDEEGRAGGEKRGAGPRVALLFVAVSLTRRCPSSCRIVESEAELLTQVVWRCNGEFKVGYGKDRELTDFWIFKMVARISYAGAPQSLED